VVWAQLAQRCDFEGTKMTYLSISKKCREVIHKNLFAVVSGDDYEMSTEAQADFDELKKSWEGMEHDKFYVSRHDDCYRTRKYTNFRFDPRDGAIEPLEHVAYKQSKKMNSVVGDLDRDFGDITDDIYSNKFFQRLIYLDSLQFPGRDSYLDRDWQCQVHMIRIYVAPYKTTDVTPEGVHSDGYPFAGVHFIGKENISGAESWVYDWEQRPLGSMIYESPLDGTFLLDRKMKHYVTPMASIGNNYGHRDLLAISFSISGTEHETLV
jgi:hypothetical protein